jgi:hypothetical protein
MKSLPSDFAKRGSTMGEAAANPVAIFETTLGSIKCEIYLNEMPLTASNFIDLAQKGFYDGLHFHRVVRLRATAQRTHHRC